MDYIQAVSAVLDDFYDSQRAKAGKYATFLWLGIGVYHFATSDVASFLTWQAAVYFIGGMFAAALIFGGIFYLLQRGITKVLLKIVNRPSPAIAIVIISIGIILMAIEAVLIFVISGWIISNLLFSESEKPQKAWTILEFQMPNGEKAEMTFHNPSFPEATLTDCNNALVIAKSDYVQTAIETAPALKEAQFIGARCEVSKDDPFKPK